MPRVGSNRAAAFTKASAAACFQVLDLDAAPHEPTGHGSRDGQVDQHDLVQQGLAPRFLDSTVRRLEELGRALGAGL